MGIASKKKRPIGFAPKGLAFVYSLKVRERKSSCWLARRNDNLILLQDQR